jgi:S-adenosylmethionine:tRNA ribosyltransferase-isomerase
MLKLQDFDYNLPPELIAQKPVSPRDKSRLLVLDKTSGAIEHRHFFDLPGYLKAGDILVVNNSKVFPARLIGRKKITGGKLEVFLLHPTTQPEIWQCLIGGRATAGIELNFGKNLAAKILKNNNDGTWEVEFNKKGGAMMKIVEQVGQVPLPPYIKRKGAGLKNLRRDQKTYQTVYAAANKIGSAAAPTAGLHFTPRLLRQIRKMGVEILPVTLHVGLGTFQPVKTENLGGHKMHSEFMEIKKGVLKKILAAKKSGRRIIAVGTTSARTLETLGQNLEKMPGQKSAPASDLQIWTDIFIRPPYQFKIVDALITNFHLPKSTLLMLAAALAGKDNIDKAYKIAIAEKYRFYSYGDAMFIR